MKKYIIFTFLLFIIVLLAIVTIYIINSNGYVNIYESNMTKQKSNSTINQNNINTLSPSDALSTIEQGLDLTIDSPQNGEVFITPNIVVKGKTNSNTSIFVNEKELKTDSQGNFLTTIILDEGENNLIVVTNDIDGNYAEQEIVVTLETPQ